MRNLAQKRARFALECVQEANRDLNETELEKFSSFAAGSPSVILQNGFGQALVFWLSKGKSRHLKVYDALGKWLKEQGFLKAFNADRRVELIEELCEMDQRKYLAAQKESLAFLEWYKRFANSNLGG
ncbi:MAG: type III-B CRISPR module-associated protein Cmr5 [Acidobacteria bacterium]|nr:MAG: type III-B CRISPR module-associated protein Cmr5 [Acidobacteriota bacterium]